MSLRFDCSYVHIEKNRKLTYPAGGCGLVLSPVSMLPCIHIPISYEFSVSCFQKFCCICSKYTVGLFLFFESEVATCCSIYYYGLSDLNHSDGQVWKLL
jgi:hypothetical protein